MIYLNYSLEYLVIPQCFKNSSWLCQGQQDSYLHYTAKITEAEEISPGQRQIKKLNPYSQRPRSMLFLRGYSQTCCLQAVGSVQSKYQFPHPSY